MSRKTAILSKLCHQRGLVFLAILGGLYQPSTHGGAGPTATGSWSGPQADVERGFTVSTYTPSGVPTSIQTPALDQGGASGQANTLLPSDVTTYADTVSSGDSETPATPANDPKQNPATSDQVSKSSDITFSLALKTAAADVANLLCTVLPGLCSNVQPQPGAPKTTGTAKTANNTKPKPTLPG